ncbi:MAG: hypothetical protein CME65_07925 [Halobacteriovoraceae bacterium]|nr:hypothetical protein [Halobacteriovoraceae bacterium]
MSQRIMLYLLLGSVSLNVYLVNLDSQNQISDQVSSKASALKIEKSYIPKKRHQNNIEFIQEEMLPEEKESQANLTEPKLSPNKEEKVEVKEEFRFDEQAARESMKTWKRESRAFIERDLGLDAEVADLYLEVREQRRRAIDAYFEPRMSEDIDEVYVWSIEDGIELAKINERYLNKLKEGMGEENYRAFSKFRQKNNRKNMENREGSVWIEF